MARKPIDLSGTPDAREAETGGEFKPLKKGWYTVEVFDAKDATDKNGKEYMSLQLRVTEGDATNRRVFDNYVVVEKDEERKWATRRAEQLARISGTWDGEDRSSIAFPESDEVKGLKLEAYFTIKPIKYDTNKAYEEWEREHAAWVKDGSDGDAPEEPGDKYRNEVTSYRPIGDWSEDGKSDAAGATGGKKAKKRKVTL